MDKLQTVVFLIRHGQTTNPQPPMIDRERVLNEQGRDQAQKMGEYLGAFGPAVVIASPYDRTQETARLIHQTAEVATALRTDQALAEIYHHHNLASREKGIVGLLENLIHEFPGGQIVVVSHQVPIEEALQLLGFADGEIAAPCQMGQGYRVVFAGDVPVECQKIDPARVT